MCVCVCSQVAEEVGELLIHCRYGCKTAQHLGTFEVDPNGAYVCQCVCGMVNLRIPCPYVTSHLSSSIDIVIPWCYWLISVIAGCPAKIKLGKRG